MAKKPLNLPATLQEKRLLDIEEQLKSLPKPVGAWRTLGRCREIPSVFFNFNRHGNVGKTTEAQALIVFLEAMGHDPIKICADPTSFVFPDIWGTKDEDGEILPNQVFGQGVVRLDLEDKNHKIIDLIDVAGTERDTVFDMKGGVFDAQVAQFRAGLDEFFGMFEGTRIFYNLDLINKDGVKTFENLDDQYRAYSQVTVETEINLVRIFSLGMFDSLADMQKMIMDYDDWQANHQFDNPSIRVHKLVFVTGWKVPEVKDFFKTKNIRHDYINYNGQIRSIIPSFLKERDAAWANILLDKQSIDEIALLSDPTPPNNPALPVKQWGKKLYGPAWKPTTE